MANGADRPVETCTDRDGKSFILAVPKLVIYLKIDVDMALCRIKKRNRPYEQDIKGGFLNELISDYLKLS